MPGPVIGLSAFNENLNNKTKYLPLSFSITTVSGALPASYVPVALSGTVLNEANLVLTATTGAILTGTTFSAVLRSATAGASILGVEIKDSTATKFLYAQGVVTTGITGMLVGTACYAAASDQVAVTAGTGLGFNLHFEGDIGGAVTGPVVICLTVVYQ